MTKLLQDFSVQFEVTFLIRGHHLQVIYFVLDLLAASVLLALLVEFLLDFLIAVELDVAWLHFFLILQQAIRSLDLFNFIL